MVKRLLTLACLAIVISAAMVPLAHAQGSGNGQGNGNGNSDNGNGGQSNAGGNGNGGENPAGGGNSGEAKGAGKADEDVALEAVRSEDALPLRDILQSVRHSTNDKVIDAQLFSMGDDLVYEVKVMAPDGHVSRLYYYAKSGRQFGQN